MHWISDGWGVFLMENGRKGWADYEILGAVAGKAYKLILKQRLIINMTAAGATDHITLHRF